MAEIRLEEKRSTSWIWWLLGAIVVGLLLWWLLGGSGDDDLVETPVTVIEEPIPEPVVVTPATGGTITDLSTLTGASAMPGMAGRPVALTGVPVARAVSDQAFWIGASEAPDAGVFAIRGNQAASFTAPDGEVDSGATVNLWGVVADMPEDLTQAATEWNIGSTDQPLLNSEAIYILADSVRLAGM